MKKLLISIMILAITPIAAFSDEDPYEDLDMTPDKLEKRMLTAIRYNTVHIPGGVKKKMKKIAKAIASDKKTRSAIEHYLVPKIIICKGMSISLFIATGESGKCNVFSADAKGLKRLRDTRYSISGGGGGLGGSSRYNLGVIFSESSKCKITGTDFSEEVIVSGDNNPGINGKISPTVRHALNGIPNRETCGSGTNHFISHVAFSNSGMQLSISTGKLTFEPPQGRDCASCP